MRPHRALPLVLCALAATLAAGCPIAPTNVAAGGRCQRSVQCVPGLVCNAMGVCTGDLTGFGTGMVPVIDAAGMDAPMMMDAGGPDTAGLDTPPLPDVPMDSPALPDVPVIMPDVPVVMPDVPVVMPDVPDMPDVPADDAGVDAP